VPPQAVPITPTLGQGAVTFACRPTHWGVRRAWRNGLLRTPARRTPSHTCAADSFVHQRSGLLRRPAKRTPSYSCEADSFVHLQKTKKQKNSSRARQCDGGYGPSGPPWGPSKNSWVWCPRLSSRFDWRKVNGEARRPAPGWTPPGGPH
jgi:hypothetical protein